MNKKILIISILTFLMLITLSLATTAYTTNNKKTPVSPLFSIRSKIAIQNDNEIRESNFIKNRLIYIPIIIEHTIFNRLLRKYYDDQGRTNWNTCLCTLGNTCKCNLVQYNQQNLGRTNWNTCLCTLGLNCK